MRPARETRPTSRRGSGRRADAHTAFPAQQQVGGTAQQGVLLGVRAVAGGDFRVGEAVAQFAGAALVLDSRAQRVERGMAVVGRLGCGNRPGRGAGLGRYGAVREGGEGAAAAAQAADLLGRGRGQSPGHEAAGVQGDPLGVAVQLGSDHDAALVAVGVATDAQHVAVEGEPVRIVRDVRAEHQLRTVHGRRRRGVLVQQHPQAAVTIRLEQYLAAQPFGVLRQARGGSDALAVQPREDLALDVEVVGAGDAHRPPAARSASGIGDVREVRDTARGRLDRQTSPAAAQPLPAPERLPGVGPPEQLCLLGLHRQQGGHLRLRAAHHRGLHQALIPGHATSRTGWLVVFSVPPRAAATEARPRVGGFRRTTEGANVDGNGSDRSRADRSHGRPIAGTGGQIVEKSSSVCLLGTRT
ncbi:hypothetical protein [Streptomyces mirabilis]